MILENTTVSVSGINGLTSKQLNIFNLLYAPLMQPVGVGFYLFLITLNDLVVPINYKLISEYTGLSLDEIEFARQECEKFLLIKTYANNNHHHIEIMAVKASHDFVSHPLLGRLYILEYSSNQLKQINSLIRENTKSFNDLVEISQGIQPAHLQDYNENLEESYQHEIKNLSNDGFDIKVFLVNSNFATFPKNLHTKENIDVILELANTYRLTNEQMRIEVTKALNDTGSHLDLDRLRNSVSSKLIPLTNEDPNPLNWPTNEFLQSKMGSISISQSVFDAIDYIRNKYNWSDGVLNVIVQYVIDNRKAIFTRNSLDQISTSMQMKKIKTQQQAIKHFSNESNFRKSKKSIKPVIKRKEVLTIEHESNEIDNQKGDLKELFKGWK